MHLSNKELIRNFTANLNTIELKFPVRKNNVEFVLKLANKILFWRQLWVCQNIYKIIMILELITDHGPLSHVIFVPEEGMTGGGTGGRDLDRRENAEEAEGGAEC